MKNLLEFQANEMEHLCYIEQAEESLKKSANEFGSKVSGV